MMKPFATLLAALAVAATPVMAQARTAERVSSPVRESEALGRFATPLLLFLAGAAAVVALILLDGGNDNTPASP